MSIRLPGGDYDRVLAYRLAAYYDNIYLSQKLIYLRTTPIHFV